MNLLIIYVTYCLSLSSQTFILFTYGEMWARAIFEIDAEYYVLQEDYDELEEENKKLKEELGEYKKMFEDHLKECYIKNTAEFMNKKFPKVNWFTEEGAPQ